MTSLLIFLFLNLSFSLEKYETDPSYNVFFDAPEAPFLVRLFNINYPDYKVEESAESGKVYILIAGYKPSNLESSNYAYNDFFGYHNRLLFNFSFEKLIIDYFGDFGIKLEAGIFISNSYGFFKNETNRSNEKVSLQGFPLQLFVVYTLPKYSSNQILVPFFELGSGYFFFSEKQEFEKRKYGKRLILSYSIGLKILLDWIDYKSAWKLDSNYGINNSYLVFSYRVFNSIDSKKTMDFTSSCVFIGFGLDF